MYSPIPLGSIVCRTLNGWRCYLSACACACACVCNFMIQFNNLCSLQMYCESVALNVVAEKLIWRIGYWFGVRYIYRQGSSARTNAFVSKPCEFVRRQPNQIGNIIKWNWAQKAHSLFCQPSSRLVFAVHLEGNASEGSQDWAKGKEREGERENDEMKAKKKWHYYYVIY